MYGSKPKAESVSHYLQSQHDGRSATEASPSTMELYIHWLGLGDEEGGESAGDERASSPSVVT